MKATVQNGPGWVRRNLAVMIASASMVAAISGWVASYQVLIHEVLVIRAMAAENKGEIKTTATVLNEHLRTHAVHVDPIRDTQARQEIIQRLDRIERKLDRIQ